VNADAILRVSNAMRERLQQALAAAGDPGGVFVGPLDDADAQGASLILFLYRVIPSAPLRNEEHTVAAPNPPPQVLVYRDALPLDLYYLLTVGTTPGASEEIRLQSLGFAMQNLQVDPVLAGPTVQYEPVRLSLETLTTEETSRIWALFPTANFRTSVAYLATPVWIDPPHPQPAAARVVRDSLNAGQRARSPGENVDAQNV
jgi:hypothetical protein